MHYNQAILAFPSLFFLYSLLLCTCLPALWTPVNWHPSFLHLFLLLFTFLCLMGFYSLASVFHTVPVAPPMLSFLKLKASQELFYFYVNIRRFLLHLISLRSQMKVWNCTAWSELRSHQSWSAALYLHLFKELKLMFGNGLRDIKACDVMFTSQWQVPNLMRTGFVLGCCMLVSPEGKSMCCFFLNNITYTTMFIIVFIGRTITDLWRETRTQSRKNVFVYTQLLISMNEVLNAVLINVSAPKSKLKRFQILALRVCVT